MAVIAMAHAPSAGAVVSCTFDAGNGLATVEVGAPNDVADFAVGGGGEIQEGGSNCGAATTATTTNILVNDNSGATTTVEILQPATFAPGAGADDIFPEIEFVLNMGSGADLVKLTGAATPNNFVVGAAGANFNAQDFGDSDLDVSYITGSSRRFELIGGPDADRLTAQGGGGTFGPFASGTVAIDGMLGNDTIDGGNGALGSSGDQLIGSGGNDTVRGFAGPDRVFAGSGNDTESGGTGGGDEDRIDYSLVQGGVNVDLAAGTQSGHPIIGTDTLSGFEEVIGTGSGDTLSGDGAGNSLQGGNGNDVLNGRSLSDALSGGGGNDTATYLDAPGGVQVNLTAGTVNGGSGNDFLASIENVTGSPAADTLTGDANANTLTGLAGTDTISALAGADSVDVRDGEADTASCGTEVDNAIADRVGVDLIDPDCETVDFIPEPDPGGGGEPPADRELEFTLAGKGKQRVLRRGGVVVKAGCPLEDCAVVFGGKVKPRTENLSAGETEKLTLGLTRKRARKLDAALDEGRRPKLAVTAEAADAAGNLATGVLKVRAKP